MATLKELSQIPERLTGGHRLCSGCGASIAVRQVLLGTKLPVVVCCATGCLEVATTIYPYTSWNVPWIHSAFENAASTMSGVETAYRALKKKGVIKDEIKFVIFGGDGGTYDIGLQALSGMLERGHNILYVCYDNEAYMNTGIQRSGATPYGASTTTQPAGKVIPGKTQLHKDLTAIVTAHNVPYAAQATIYYWRDLVNKATKAFETKGPSFINVLSPCHRGWRYPQEKTLEISRLAVETCFWPLYEVEQGNGKNSGYGGILRITYRPKEKKPVTEFLKLQGRFKHLFEERNKHLLDEIQNQVDEHWNYLEKLSSLPK
ncbi:MAG: thiamine pyrophosphate-dependent enzyme [Elusimicrobiota bacterium]|nr:thiamine pyrophosphate-dependent enzyme [Elusimicrobiota bacterium]